MGATGQARMIAAHAFVAARVDDLAVETVTRYLLAAGVGRITCARGTDSGNDERTNDVSADTGVWPDNTNAGTDAWRDDVDPRVQRTSWPSSALAWHAALDGVSVIVRAGFDDDAMLFVARAHGIPVIVARGQQAQVDVLSFTHAPALGLETPDVAPSPVAAAMPPAVAVFAGTLAATEALWLLVGRGDAPARGARHLSWPLDGGDPSVVTIPWPPGHRNDDKPE